MMGFSIFLIILIYVLSSVGKKKKKPAQRKPVPVKRESRKIIGQGEIHKKNRIHNNIHKERNPVTYIQEDAQQNNPLEPKVSVNSEPIQADKKKEKVSLSMEKGDAGMMNSIKDIIVCGYPTQLQNQRDFIKEGEDFLASLGTDSFFL